MKKILFTVLFCSSIGQIDAQTYEFIRNGDFALECGANYTDKPCFWIERSEGGNGVNVFWPNVAHLGRKNLNGFIYQTLNTCDSTEVNYCSRDVFAGSDINNFPPLNFDKETGQFGILNSLSPGNCVGSSNFKLLFDPNNTNIDKHCIFLAPGYGAWNRGGIETHLGEKLPKGEYILSFDLAIPLPSLNTAFNFEVYLNSSQNDKDEQIFKLSNATGSTMEPGVWKHFEKTICIENNDDKKFEWLSLINERCESGLAYPLFQSIYIDNVSFIDKCIKDEGPCSPFLGEPDPHFEVMPNGNSVCVSNLGNIKYNE